MQKRLALLNEEELSEIESDIDKINNEENEKINNNLNSFQNLCTVDKNEKNKVKSNKDSEENLKLSNQLLKNSNEDIKKYICDKCGKVCQNALGLHSHKKTHQN